MEIIGFAKQELVCIFQLVAGVLKLGNVQFQHHSNIDGTDGCKLSNEDGRQNAEGCPPKTNVTIYLL